MSGERRDWVAPGRARVSPFVVVRDAMQIVRFAEEVFDAVAVSRPLFRADGRLWNHEIRIGESTIMFGDGEGDMIRPAFLYVHVPDAVATYERALAAGARAAMPPERRFYGAIDGGVEDMAGNLWWIATQVEDLSEDEIARRARAEDAQR